MGELELNFIFNLASSTSALYSLDLLILLIKMSQNINDRRKERGEFMSHNTTQVRDKSVV